MSRPASALATILASLVIHAAASARPRPTWFRWMSRTPTSSAASAVATSRVESVLAQSAIVIRAEKGNAMRRNERSLRTARATGDGNLHPNILFDMRDGDALHALSAAQARDRAGLP